MSAGPADLVTLGRTEGAHGEVVLRRRIARDEPTEPIDELIVNGVFAMDSSDPSSERELGRLPPPSARVLLGGLGLGFTAAELLDRGVQRLDVVELEPALVGWAEQRLTATLGRVAGDHRTQMIVADIADVLQNAPAGSWDAILLDVDNGPDFLVHQHNLGLYAGPGLRAAQRALAPGGMLAVWCQGPSPELRAALRDLGGEVSEQRHRARRGRREWSYVIYVHTEPVRDNVAMPADDDTTDFRIERDTMGEVRVPAAALYQAQTQRAVENFPISGVPIDPSLISALGLIKGAAAQANAELGVLAAETAAAIVAAAAEVAAGEHDGEFPIDVFQTGSGTSSNMNTNEVIASLATRSLGRGGASQRPRQRLAVQQRRVPQRDPHRRHRRASINALIPALRPPRDVAEAKAAEFAEVVKSGRTHLMDATPVTLGQEFGGYAAQVRYGDRAGPGRTPPGRRAAAGRDRRRHRHQHPARLRRRGDRASSPSRHGSAAHRGAGPLRGPGRPGRTGRGVRRAAHHRGQPEQDRQRPALDGLGAARRARRDRAARPAARLLDHARQGEPGDLRGHRRWSARR